jgi:hypothetical protein
MTLAPERPTVEQPLSGCPRRRPPTRVVPLEARATGTASPTTAEAPPLLADGVQLLGEYAGTGYLEPQYLGRRPGGQLVQLSPLLHEVAQACDGSSSEEQIAERVTRSYGKAVSADNVRTLLETKLRPLGIVAAADGSSPPTETSDPLLALKLRTQLLGPGAVHALARLARPLFWSPVVFAVIAGLLTVDVWLFFLHGIGSGLRATVQQPAVFLVVIAVVVVSAALHELGHAAACAYGGARPGGMGAGIYVVWPAFYTDVTEAYRLDRRGRLRTDLGGVYINGIIVITIAAIYAATSYEPLVLLCLLLQIQVLQQLLPFLRLDGYYVLADLVGVPDLFRRIGPVLRSVIPFRDPEPSVTELKPWVRRVVVGWVFVLVPVLAVNLGYFLLAAPRIAATSWDSASRFVGIITTAGGAAAVWAAVQLMLLLLPTIGAAYTFVRVARRGSVGAWRWSAGSPPRRLAVVTSGLGMAALLAVTWYPDGRLSPYRDRERGTLQQHARELTSAGRGSPLLRSPRAAQEPLPPYEEKGRGDADHSREGADPAAPTKDKKSGSTSGSVAPTPSDSATPTSTRSDDEATSTRSDTSTPTSNGSNDAASPTSSPTSSSAGATATSSSPSTATSTQSSSPTSTRSTDSDGPTSSAPRTATSTRSGDTGPTSSRRSTPTSTRTRDTDTPTSTRSGDSTSTRSSDTDEATSTPSRTPTPTRSGVSTKAT